MKETLEKIISYVLGSVIGLALGSIALTFNSPYLMTLGSPAVLALATMAGMLISSALVEYKVEKTAVENKKIRDETVALITHELRTGLTSTGWAIQVILEHYKDKLEHEHYKMLEDVEKSIGTTVMHSINLLDVSLLEIGKLKIALKWEPLSTVEHIFRDVINKYSLGARHAGITLTSSIALDSKRLVEIDTTRLRIILENLLENSMQYTTGDVKTIDVKIDNDASSLKMTVSDSGIGIPFDEQEKIFSEFFRASNARRKLSTGSGIGLHMCYQYVKAHHGTIRFESTEGKGTAFFITIPLKTSADVDGFLKKI